MGTLQKSYSIEKLQGKIYTPEHIVKRMLDEIGWVGKGTLGKTILDPACGNGRFLVEIIKRILHSGGTEQEIIQSLHLVHGWDIDNTAVQECIHHLNQILQPYSWKISWNIQVKNSLLEIEKFNSPLLENSNKNHFDVIIGNPPYIRIQHLSEIERKFIQKNFKFCSKGSTDIYIAFFELCFQLLKDEGIGCLITPNTFLYTETGKFLRQYIQTHQNVLKIINFKSYQIFPNATTYSAITLFNRKKNFSFEYEEWDANSQFLKENVSYFQIHKDNWFGFRLKSDSKGVKLKDICKIGVGITTLSDKCYIFKNFENYNENLMKVKSHYQGDILIEKSILKPIIKGSTYKGDEGLPNEYILFPYKKIQGKYQIIPENELKDNFPFAYNYLLSVKPILDKRDNGKPNPVAWYAFGRNQSLDSAFGKKIIFSPMNQEPQFRLSFLEDCTLYSGYFIKFDGDYEMLLAQLNSQRMKEYIENNSRDFRGGWKAYNKKIVENFEIFL